MHSQRYLMWRTWIDLKTCISCKDLHGKIYEVGKPIEQKPPLHERCRCIIERLRALFAGTATQNGTQGADWWLKQYGTLPGYYLSRQEAMAAGWKGYLGNLHLVLPGKMFFGGIHENRNRHLPSAPGRIWYEADINYTQAHRGTARVVFSNDGLIFVTYDHYLTFIEII